MTRLMSEGFVHFDNLEFDAETFRIMGAIACSHRMIITVSKLLERLDQTDDPLVQTVMYQYNAHIHGEGELYRVDNTHPYKGHADHHHEHLFSKGGGEVVSWLGADRWPTLSDFVRRVEELSGTNAFGSLPPASDIVTQQQLDTARDVLR